MTKQDFFEKAIVAAIASGHPWPEYAVCEAALESAWGESQSAKHGNNLFGQKSGFSTKADGYLIKILPTKEWDSKSHEFVIVDAKWVCFPDWETAFRERLELLQRLPLYKEALAATSGEEFVREVSKHWATDPKRADKVLLTYRYNKNRIKEVLDGLA